MRSVLKLDEARQMTPSVTDVAGCVMRLQGAVFDSVSESDVRKIMERMKSKALDGDQKAAEFLLNFIANPKVSYTRRDVNVTTKNSTTTAEPETLIESPPAGVLTFARRAAARVLGTTGALAVDRLAAELGLAVDDLRDVLLPPQFAFKKSGEVHLTAVGRAELLG